MQSSQCEKLSEILESIYKVIGFHFRILSALFLLLEIVLFPHLCSYNYYPLILRCTFLILFTSPKSSDQKYQKHVSQEYAVHSLNEKVRE